MKIKLSLLVLVVLSVAFVGRASADIVNYRVAVVPYTIKVEDSAGEITSMIIDGLSKQGFQTVDAGLAARSARLGEENVEYGEAIAQISQQTGARVVITGEFSSRPDKEQWVFTSNITDTSSGQSVVNQFVYPLSESYTDAPPKVAAMIAEFMAKKLNLPIPDGAGL